MGQTARRLTSQDELEISIGVFEEGNDTPVRVVTRRAPDGTPSEVVHLLADYMAHGYNAKQREIDLSTTEEVPSLDEFVRSRRGRPTSDESEREGREASRLRMKGRTGGQIAPRVCRERRANPRHRCKKRCIDRIMKNADQYDIRQELKRLAEGDVT